MNATTQAQAQPAASAEPVHQFRTKGCADWYDGHPDNSDGGGPYEIRTLYTAPAAAPVSAEPIAVVVRDENDRAHAVLRDAGAELPHGTGLYAAPVSAEPVAVLRFDRGTPGRENEMPTVVSCNRFPDGEYEVYAALVATQAQPLPDSLVPTAPDLEYLRGVVENTALPAFMRGQIAAAVKKLTSRSSGNPGELPELPDIAPTDDWDSVLDDIRRYGDACYRAGQAQQDADTLTVADYEEVLADKRRQTAELGRLLMGDDAPAQPSLCDLVSFVKSEGVVLAGQQDADKVDADPIRALLALHSECLEDNDYTYFELARTRHTAWMAWICSHPVETHPDRKVLAKGQGETPEEACSAALINYAARKEPDQ